MRHNIGVKPRQHKRPKSIGRNDMMLWKLHGARAMCLATLLAASVLHAAPRYVESPALASTLNTAIGDVGNGPVQVPIITWGGDIATILANGNQARTSRGSIFAQEQLDVTLVREDVFAKQVQS